MDYFRKEVIIFLFVIAMLLASPFAVVLIIEGAIIIAIWIVAMCIAWVCGCRDIFRNSPSELFE